jgi:cell division ATPase FtsA
MITTKVSGAQRRNLLIDFEAYTDGDAEFKAELILLMIDNLIELQDTVMRAGKANDLKLFQTVCHKVKATVEMLADPELSQTIVELKITITNMEKVVQLQSVCAEIIDSLRQEIV